MLRTPFIMMMLCISTITFAQKTMEKAPTMNHTPKFFVGTSSGLNNESGLIGFNLELPLSQQVSIGSGIGSSSWGGKAYLEARYYFNDNYRGWAIGGGFSHSIGFSKMKLSLPVEPLQRDQDVTITAKPMTNMFIAGYRLWKLGKRNNRFYLTAGYSVPFTTTKYDVTSGQTLTSDGDKTVKILSPGGLIAALGFSFAL